MDEVTARTPYGAFHAMPDDLITRQLQEFGGHTRNELAMVLRFVRPRDGVLDVGAHIGMFAVPLGERVCREGHVFAFEPCSRNRDLLARNVMENGVAGAVSVVENAVSDSCEQLGCQVTPGNSGATFLSAGARGEVVETIALDEWWDAGARSGGRPAALIKVDTEGMETRVLRGAGGILRDDRPILYLEYSPDNLRRAGSSAEELTGVLGDHGYHCFTNLGPRNSDSDTYELGRVARPSHVGAFGDLLCFHPHSPRYPSYFASEPWSWSKMRVNEFLRPARSLMRRIRPRAAA